MTRLYAALCILGAALPLTFLGIFIAEHGLALREFLDQVTESPISLFAWADVAVAAIVVAVFAVREGTRGLRLWWLAVVATFMVGVSLGLPLLLFLRARAQAQGPVSGAR
jgi:hypothetical protein